MTGFTIQDRKCKLLLIFICCIESLMIITYYTTTRNIIPATIIKYVPITFPQMKTEPSIKTNPQIKTETPKMTEPPINESSYFQISPLTPQEILRRNENKTYQGYLDKEFSGTCGIPPHHDQLFVLVKEWMKIAAKNSIPWWMIYGSLIGSIRHKDVVAWDSDIDVGVPTQYESIIRNLSVSPQNISSDKINIIVRPGAHCPHNEPRLDCKGKTVYAYTDNCAFCNPLGRVLFRLDVRIDIFLHDMKIHNNELQVTDEGTFEGIPEPIFRPFHWYFPLKTCSFMNYEVLCPRKTENVLNSIYGSFASKYKCVKGEWVKI